MDFLMSVILQSIMRQPFLIVITAFLLNTIVSPLQTIEQADYKVHNKSHNFLNISQVGGTKLANLALGTVNLAKMMPAMQAWMMTPTMDWRHITTIATSHCSVVAL